MSIHISDRAAFKASNSAKANEPDFMIKLGPYVWRVHSSVISKSSQFFAKTCQGTFKEAQDKVITLHDDNPFMVARMIQFMYCGTYMLDPNHRITTNMNFPAVFDLINDCIDNTIGSNGSYKGPSAYSNAQIIAMVYVVADKYMIPGLIKTTQTQMIDAIKSSCYAFTLIISITGVVALHDTAFCHGMLEPLANNVRAGGPGYILYKAAVKNDSRVDQIMGECMKEAAKKATTGTKALLQQAVDAARITITTHEQATLAMSNTIVKIAGASEVADNLFFSRMVKRKLDEIDTAMNDYQRRKRTLRSSNV